jgi:sugar O-acyltransferase (sialic acid O-acetyltransferase NeuD family)
MRSEVVIHGGTGNFKVLCELLGDTHRVIGYFDNNPAVAREYRGIPCLGGDREQAAWAHGIGGEKPYFLVSIGHGKAADRLAVHARLKALGLRPMSAVHRTAYVAPNATLGEGTMVFAMASVCVDARIGDCCILNTRASVDHECVLEDGVALGPGATLAGEVHVGRGADIYTGAVVLPRIRIGEGAVVAAGAVVRDHVAPHTLVAGVPARVIRTLVA